MPMPSGSGRSLGGIVASLPGVTLWSWLHAGTAAALLTAGLGALLLRAHRHWPAARVAGLCALCAGYWLSRFYVFGPDGLPRADSLSRIPHGRVLLTLLTLIAGVGVTALLIGPAREFVTRIAGQLGPRLDALLYV